MSAAPSFPPFAPTPEPGDAGLVTAMILRIDRRLERRSGPRLADTRREEQRRAVWAAQDAALERSWRTMALEAQGIAGFDPLGDHVTALGYGSSQWEAQLMRAPPRDDAARFVLDELHRRGGREWEGRIARLVSSERLATRYEIRLGVHWLLEDGKVERIRSHPPEWLHAAELTEGQKMSARDWTGWDLRAVKAERYVCPKCGRRGIGFCCPEHGPQ
jgi:hypothetical protein